MNSKSRDSLFFKWTQAQNEKGSYHTALSWAQLGSNQRPPDYESGAANQLSYGPNVKTDCNISYLNVIMQAPHKKKIS